MIFFEICLSRSGIPSASFDQLVVPMMTGRATNLSGKGFVTPQTNPSALLVGIESRSTILPVTTCLSRRDCLPVLQIFAVETEPAVVLESTSTIVSGAAVRILPLLSPRHAWTRTEWESVATARIARFPTVLAEIPSSILEGVLVTSGK